MSESCGSCRFWSNELKEFKDEVGFCRRNPPQIIDADPTWEDDGRSVYGGCFPATCAGHWCGEYATAKAESVGTRLMDRDISFLQFSTRTEAVLVKAGIKTLRDLLDISALGLVDIRGFGRRQRDEIYEKVTHIKTNLQKMEDTTNA